MTDVGILGGDAVRGNPDGMASVSRFLRSTADEIASVRHELTHNALHGSWQGAAASAFRELLSHVPEDLDKAARSYRLASETVSQYAGRLRTAHDLAQQLANQLAALQAQAGRADAGVRTAQRAVDDARRTLAHATPQTRAHAQQVLNQRIRSLSSLSDQRAGLQRQIDDIRRRAAANRHELDHAARWAQDQLHEASKLGIRNSIGSWLDRNSHLLHTIGAGTLKVLKVVSKTLIDAYELPFKVIAYIKDPSWAKLSDLLDNLSAALTVLTIVATIALVVGTGGAGLALVPEIIGGLKMAQVAVAGAKLGVDSYRKFGLHENVSYVDIGIDALGVGTAGMDAAAAEGAFKQSWVSALHDSGNSTEWKKYAARVVVFNEGKPTTNVILGKEMTKYVGNLVADPLKDAGRNWAEDQAIDFVSKHVPAVGIAKDPKIQTLLHSSANLIKHTITLPTTLPHVPVAKPLPA